MPTLDSQADYAVAHNGAEYAMSGADLKIKMTSTQALITPLIVEFIGTFYLCFVASSAGIAGVFGPLAVGAVLSVVVYFGGHISGGTCLVGV
jgi:glycerol uptake facilitator-like aquaporin